jgi:hypothetical protein
MSAGVAYHFNGWTPIVICREAKRPPRPAAIKGQPEAAPHSPIAEATPNRRPDWATSSGPAPMCGAARTSIMRKYSSVTSSRMARSCSDFSLENAPTSDWMAQSRRYWHVASLTRAVYRSRGVGDRCKASGFPREEAHITNRKSAPGSSSAQAWRYSAHELGAIDLIARERLRRCRDDIAWGDLWPSFDLLRFGLRSVVNAAKHALVIGWRGSCRRERL